MVSEPFISDWRRGEMSDEPQADALHELYVGQLGSQVMLAVAQNGDLQALMGGRDPLSLPRPEAKVDKAILVTGWDKDGRPYRSASLWERVFV